MKEILKYKRFYSVYVYHLIRVNSLFKLNKYVILNILFCIICKNTLRMFPQGCCENGPGFGVRCHQYSLFTGSVYCLGISRCRSEIHTGNIELGRQPPYSVDICFTPVSSSLYLYVQYLVLECHSLHVQRPAPRDYAQTWEAGWHFKGFAIMRLSSFDYRITTLDWENLSALQERHACFLCAFIFTWHPLLMEI